MQKRKMTKSIRVANDYDIKIRYRGEEWFISLEDLKVKGQTLGEHVEALNGVIKDVKNFKDDYKLDAAATTKRLDDTEEEVARLSAKVDKLQKGLEDVLRGVLSR